MVEQESSVSTGISTDTLKIVIKNQYHASLKMLRGALEQCPDTLWVSKEYINPFWRIAYHTLYFMHLYSQRSVREFTPWEHHQTGIHDMDDVPAPPEILELTELPHRPPQTGEPYTKAEILEYWAKCDGELDDAIDAMDIHSADSGFSWYSVSKLEHQIIAIRHIQHHTAQLGVLLRSHANVGMEWLGRDR